MMINRPADSEDEQGESDAAQYLVEVCPLGHVGRGILLNNWTERDEEHRPVVVWQWLCESCGERWIETDHEDE